MLGAGWLALSVPVLVGATFLIVRVALSLVRSMRSAVLAAVPLRAEQIITLDLAGTYDLFVEGRLLSTDFGGLQFALIGGAGTPVPLDMVFMRTKVSSFSRARLQVGRFQLAAGGRYTMRVTGIKPDQDPDNRLLVCEPRGLAIVGHVLALVGLGMLAVGSLVATLLVLIPKSSIR